MKNFLSVFVLHSTTHRTTSAARTASSRRHTPTRAATPATRKSGHPISRLARLARPSNIEGEKATGGGNRCPCCARCCAAPISRWLAPARCRRRPTTSEAFVRLGGRAHPAPAVARHRPGVAASGPGDEFTLDLPGEMIVVVWAALGNGNAL